MSEHTWQPIETAPKDGTVILLSDKHCVHAGAWAPIIKGDSHPWAFFEGFFNHSPVGCCDREDGERIEVNGWMECGPSHWMPLPTPPQATGKEA